MNKSIINLEKEMSDVDEHCKRVGEYAYTFAKELGFSEEMAQEMYIAGREHDLGKLFISEEILHAQRKLTDEEREAVKKHTSPENLNRCLFTSELSRQIAEEHHKDASEISEFSQIVAICDVYDALTAKRSYEKEVKGSVIKNTFDGFSKERAIEIMMTDPRQDNLNRELVTLFAQIDLQRDLKAPIGVEESMKYDISHRDLVSTVSSMSSLIEFIEDKQGEAFLVDVGDGNAIGFGEDHSSKEILNFVTENNLWSKSLEEYEDKIANCLVDLYNEAYISEIDNDLETEQDLVHDEEIDIVD